MQLLRLLEQKLLVWELASLEIIFQLKILESRAQKIFLQLEGVARLNSCLADWAGFPLVSTNCSPLAGEFLPFELETGVLLFLIEMLRKMSIKYFELFKIT